MTWPSEEDVQRYLNPQDALATGRPEPPAVGKLWVAELEGEPGGRKVEGGGHAMQLAEDLAQALNRHLAKYPAQTVHFFGAAPNAFWVFLGRECRFLADRIQLYEFSKGRTYVPSLTLPLPAPNNQ
jgi:hypothetical protein